MRRLDLVTGLVTTAVGAFAFCDARDLAMFGANHVPGPGFFPKILAGLLAFLGLVLAGISLRDNGSPAGEHGEGAEEPSTRSGRLRAMAVLFAFGVIALYGVIGFAPWTILAPMMSGKVRIVVL